MLSVALSGCPVRLVNDANAALLAECWVGACINNGGCGDDCRNGSHKNVVMVTLGSGVGVAVLSDGVLLQGSRGLIEAGHSIIHFGNNQINRRVGGDGSEDTATADPPPARECGCGQHGCIEAYVSANSVRKRFAEARKLRFGSIEGEDMSTADIFSLAATCTLDASTDTADAPAAEGAAEGGGEKAAEVSSRVQTDPLLSSLAAEVVDETARYLALFCINICRFYDTRTILLGGGMADAGRALLDPVRKYFQAFRWTSLGDHSDLICFAKLGQQAGVVGAAAVVKDLIPLS